MIENYPLVMKSGNVGEKPNDALFHAEATTLMRAARANGGTLSGKEFDLHVDRKTCGESCLKVLPLLTRELGYPTVRIFDGTGRNLRIRGGNGGLLSIDGILGTEAMAEARNRANATLYITGDRTYGVTLFHRLWDGRIQDVVTNHSRGDLARRLEFTKTGDGDELSIGLFIPFEKAWLAVEDFMNGDGALSQRIAWVNGRDLPADTFPEH